MTSYEENELEFVGGLGPEAVAAAESAASAVTEDDQPPKIETPDDGPVTLPGGFRRMKVGGSAGPQFETVTTAWVQELDGYAEEHIAKARLKGEPSAFVGAILECGVKRLGNSEPTQEDFNSLLVGDRDFLILEISKATYGNDLEYEDFPCQFCGEMLAFTVHKDEDIPSTRLEKPEDAEFPVKLRSGDEITVHLPTSEEQAVSLETSESTAQFNTILIAHCAFGGDVEQAKSLGIKDRQTILRELSDKMPGPRYNEVTFEHPECGNTNRLAVSLAGMFLGL